eukprot:349632-Chlamydomonas_euryale.AAC.48
MQVRTANYEYNTGCGRRSAREPRRLTMAFCRACPRQPGTGAHTCHSKLCSLPDPHQNVGGRQRTAVAS